MQFEWDETKNQINIKKNGLSFKAAEQLFTKTLVINEDLRFDYKEDRYIGYGEIDNRLMCVVYTERKPNKIRIISFRKANKREKKYYEQCNRKN